MQTEFCQRWIEKRPRYKPAGEQINKRLYEVAEIKEHGLAKAFVEAHHYSGSFPAARSCFGLYLAADLVGVLVFSEPMHPKVLGNVFGEAGRDSAELGRLVLLDAVPGMGETWFLGRVFRLIKTRYAGILSFSDPVPRYGLDGVKIFKGHIGTIYQGHNARYLGRATPRSLKILHSGEVLSDRAAQKVRGREKGWEYAAAKLERCGAKQLTAKEDSRAWLRHWLARLSRTFRHPGNFRYAWALDKGLQLPEGQTYPKVTL